MNKEIVISAENLTKYYYISEGIFSFHKKDRVIKALEGLNLEVKKGEILGIIGRNGSGKSTLLKILSQVTKPSKGKAEIHGKLVSAIEVTSGFNFDLSGKENIRNTAQIWGLKSKEIQNIEEKIIEFCNLSKFIHLPVKKFSTGMISKLAASIIIHIKADIYILDEALNGSDQVFSRKMNQKLIDLQNENKTIIIASHKITDLISLCNKAIVLDEGKIIHSGNTFEAIIFYQKIIKNNILDIVTNNKNNFKNNYFKFNDFRIISSKENYKFTFTIKPIINSILNSKIYIVINNSFDIPIGHSSIELTEVKKEIVLSCNFPNKILSNGIYIISLAIKINEDNWLFFPRVFEFEANNNNIHNYQFIPGLLISDASWEISNKTT
ncbi:MAG: ABC transporter ATP-binding protein [Bacteroidia bacterium]|nr:ABC transporter ATP-binding protein [Bacteroidia bacterium]